MADMNRAGTYELLEFRIAPFDRNFEDTNAFIDIRGLIHEWELNESMDSGHIYGTAVVYDSLGILDDFQIKTDPVNHWIKGEERIRIRYKDWYPDHEPMEHEMFLYSVTDVQPITTAKEALRVYKIHFVSIDKFLTERFLVRRGFRDKLISENVEGIFKEYWNRQGNNYRRLPKKDLYLEETTEGKQNLVVPNYSPEQTMHFFARKAYAGEGKTQIWRFFENRKAYFFITHDTLAAEANALEAFSGEIQKYVRINIGDKTPGTEAITMQSILDIRQPTYINTLKDMLTGAYYSSLTELDIPNRTPTFVEYRYLDEYENLETTSYLKADKKYGVAPRPRHSKKFVDEHLNTLRDRLVVRDYGSPNDPGGGAFVRPETFYTDVYNDKRVSYNHHDSNKILMKIYGNNEVMAGSIIEIDLLKLDNDTENPKTDELRSGRYLVESVKNIFKEELYYQELTISAAGVYAKPERANEYVRERLPLSEFTERETFFNESDGGRDADGTRPGDTQTNNTERKLTNAQVNEILGGESVNEARRNAESFLGRSMSDEEWDNLVAATVAESLPNSPQEQAYIMGVILNRARSDRYPDNIVDVLNQRNQFQAVTGTATTGPSGQFTNPPREQIASTIDGVNTHLNSASTSWLNFTSNISAAYGPGTDISFRDKVKSAPGSKVVGGTVFGTVR